LGSDTGQPDGRRFAGLTSVSLFAWGADGSGATLNLECAG